MNFDYRVKLKRNLNGDVVGICWTTGVMMGHCHDDLTLAIMLDI